MSTRTISESVSTEDPCTAGCQVSSSIAMPVARAIFFVGGVPGITAFYTALIVHLLGTVQIVLGRDIAVHMATAAIRALDEGAGVQAAPASERVH